MANRVHCLGYFRNPDHLPVYAFVAPVYRDGTYRDARTSPAVQRKLDDSMEDGVTFRHLIHRADCRCPALSMVQVDRDITPTETAIMG